MITNNYYEDNDDLQFNMDHFVDWESLVPLQENDFADYKEYQKSNDERFSLAPSNVQETVDFYKEVSSQYGEIMGKKLAPAALDMDKEGLRFEDGKVFFPKQMLEVAELLSESGLIGYAVSRHYGGLHMPLTAQVGISEMSARADASFTLTLGCYNLAEVVERFGDDAMKEKYLPRMVSGEMIGAMSLTEPDFGSDLPHIRTRAIKQEDGTYRLQGTKRFITHGCGIGEKPAAILTLARSGGEGARGLSFFLVESNDIEVSRIEEKMGLHCSPTCELVYDNAKALLIGEEGKGLVKYSMDMMNGARIGIATQSLGIAHAAYTEAKQYASQRQQFGNAIESIPAVKRLLNVSQAKVHAMRALNFKTSEFVDIYDGLTRKFLREGHEERSIRKQPEVLLYDKLAKLMTPVAKFFCSEQANQVAYDCLQVYGGYGFTEEYPASKISRDARITTIYEGTSQLQVLAAFGGIMEGTKENAPVRNYLQEKIDKLENKELGKRLSQHLASLANLALALKEFEKEVKDMYAFDLVSYYAYFFSLLALAQQEEVAKKLNHPIYQTKKEMLVSFEKLAQAEMAAIEYKINNEK